MSIKSNLSYPNRRAKQYVNVSCGTTLWPLTFHDLGIFNYFGMRIISTLNCGTVVTSILASKHLPLPVMDNILLTRQLPRGALQFLSHEVLSNMGTVILLATEHLGCR